MAGMFDDQKKKHENKFAHDMELGFKVNARSNKLLALWAAEEMHMDQADAMEYAMEVVESGLRLTQDWDVVNKVLHDLNRKGLKHNEKDVRRKYQEVREVAAEQIQKSS